MIVGGCMMMLSTLCAVAYSIILMTIWRDDDLMALISYRLMFALGVVDVLQCVPHFITGVFTIFQSIFHRFLAKGISILGTPCYIGYCIITIILTLNRFIQLIIPRLTYLNINITFKALIGIVVVFWCYFAFFLASPWATMVYVPQCYSWKYDFSLPLSSVIQKSALTVELICIITVVICYSCVIIDIYVKRKHLSSTIGNQSEIRIFVQASVIATYCAILNVLWHISQEIEANLWILMTLNFMWLLSSGVYPVVYFISNR
ncbi:hypothetical protein DICVIV_04352 [Dictyocaulus viviparus]|uniref:7TM GPCR serpentine receptor class x (Srx) domain-containing protein n=1 Tax=Dictyocaulus viviparus TaxID=29172 RepID=A0A0D8XXX8_DICVI|nr:hypothetical protein DICVIV_04352 [Dictyocaulus viviparus]